MGWSAPGVAASVAGRPGLVTLVDIVKAATTALTFGHLSDQQAACQVDCLPGDGRQLDDIGLGCAIATNQSLAQATWPGVIVVGYVEGYCMCLPYRKRSKYREGQCGPGMILFQHGFLPLPTAIGAHAET